MAQNRIEEWFNKLAYYNTDYNILVCKKHGYSIKKPNLKTHFTTLHPGDIPAQYIKKLVEFGLGVYQEEPIYPREPIKPIPYLKLKKPVP